MYGRPEISLTMLTAFLAVARCLHFGRAADELRIAQPALSQHIRRLEDNVGCKLLDRNTRNVQLTPAGEILRKLGERIFDELANGLERVKRAGRGETGLVIVGFTATIALRALPAAVKLHRSAYPDVQLELVELLPDMLSERLMSGQIDVAIARELKFRPEFDVTPAGFEQHVAVLPSALADDMQAPLALGRLRDEPFILFPTDNTSTYTQNILELCAEAGFTPKTRMVVSSWQNAVSLVGINQGATILPECTRCLQIPGVAFVELEGQPRSRLDIAFRCGEERQMIWNFIESARAAIASL